MIGNRLLLAQEFPVRGDEPAGVVDVTLGLSSENWVQNNVD